MLAPRPEDGRPAESPEKCAHLNSASLFRAVQNVLGFTLIGVLREQVSSRKCKFRGCFCGAAGLAMVDSFASGDVLWGLWST